MVYSGTNEKLSENQRGTAVVLLGNIRNAWKENKIFTPINERLLKLRLKTEKLWLSIIAVYAPTEVEEAIISDEFYDQLQVTLDEVNKKDVILVLGDFNARIGPSLNPSNLHGVHNPDKCNKNGERLIDFCNQNGLAITNTLFPHKNIHQWTWKHPSQKEGGHVLDYILIDKMFKKLMMDIRA